MKKIIYLATISIFVMTFSISSVTVKNSYAHSGEKHGSAKSNLTYTENINPIFKEKCSKCHGSKSPEHMEFIKDIKKYTEKKKGPRMDKYSHLTSFIVWPDTGSLMRALDNGENTENGKPGKMYKHLGKSEEERQKNLNVFKKWVGNWTLKGWSSIKKDEIGRMNLEY